MRKILSICALAAVLAACGPQQKQAQAPAPAACEKVATNVVAFTAPGAQDVVETRAFGAECRSAVVVLTVRNSKGQPLWAWATPYGWPGDPSVNGSGVTAEAMDQFLADWGKVNVDTTASLPDWPERDTVFAGELGAFMSTPYDRDTYLEIRSKAYPRLCHATGIESGLCVYLDPQSGAVFKVFESGA